MRITNSSFLVRLFAILSAVVAVHASALADGDKAPPARSPFAAASGIKGNPKVYVLPMQGILGLDFDGQLVKDVLKDIGESKPDLVIIDVDAGSVGGKPDDVRIDPRRQLSAISGLRDEFAVLHAGLQAVPVAVLVRNGSGLYGVAALAWPTIFLAPAGSIGGIDLDARIGSGDSDVRAKMVAVWKSMAMGITALGGHDGAQTDLLFASKAVDAAAARTAKLSSGECADVAGVVKALGYASSVAVGNGAAITAKASTGWRSELVAVQGMLSKFQESLDGPADIAGRIELMKKVKAQMEFSPRLARVLEWSVGLNVERAAELIAALEKQSAAIAPPRVEKIGSHRVVLVDLSGGLGETAFASAVTKAGQMADADGPGQIIVLEIDSSGGLVSELYKFVDAIRAVRERHRVVAWVRQAISGAAVTSMQCNEIYFRSMGAVGAATMIRGRESADGETDKFLAEMGDIIEKNGRPRSVFEAIVKTKAVLTYTKDPATGKSTFHDKITGLPGEVVLSDEKDNLTFNASNALDCGFSKGTADSLEQLAPLLGLR
jgi:ATP-dependent protease ClpP protease subunit